MANSKHVGDWKFGDGVRIEEHTGDIARVPKRFVSTDVQILMRERYEQSHGIYDHQAAQGDHFALVRHHWCEDTIVASRLRERFEGFLDARLGRELNISFNEFLEWPSYMCDLALEVMEKRAPAQDQELTNLLTEMKKGQGKN